MARLVKGKYYDLNQTFSDEEGNRYSRRAADTLVLWMNMGSTPTDKGPKSLTTSYEGSPTTSTSAMTAGGTIRDTVQFDDSGAAGTNGLVAANAALSPSTLASGGTPTTTSDLPFSISFWVNFSSYPTGQGHYLFAKDTTGGYDYLGSLTTAKKLELIIRDDDNTKLQSVITSTAVDSDSVFKGLNTWNHLVFTYDGRAGNTAYAGMKIYINGVSRTVQNDGSQTGYVGIRPTHTLPLYVGSFYDGTREVDGQMAEFCMWNDYALNASDVKALYNVSAKDRGTISGQLGNPARVVLRDRDVRLGTYPTIASTGDPDFTGKYTSTFDDTNTILFESFDNRSTATVTFTNMPANAGTITIVSSDGTTKAYYANTTATAQDLTTDPPKFYGADAAAAATSLKACIETLTGHNGKITVVDNKSGHLNLTQVFPGTIGDTTITDSATNVTTTNFSGGDGGIVYPTGLPVVSKFVSGGVATPNILQGLTALGTSSVGVPTFYVTSSFGESISPFNDSRVYIDNDLEFYTTGTASGSLPGFDQRLSSKTILTFDINPSVAQDVFFSTGTANGSPWANHATGLANGVNSGLVYFNWATKRWDVVGNAISGSNMDFLNPDPAVRSNAPHAFTGLPQFAMTADPDDLWHTARHVGRPHSTHGFPFAEQYDMSGSNILSLSGTLASPFLLEKATVEFSGSFHRWPGKTLADGPLAYNFFLLSISPLGSGSANAVNIVQDLTGSSNGLTRTTTTREYSVNQLKDLVWTGEIARIQSDEYDRNPPVYGRDLNIFQVAGRANSIPAITGTFRVESPARSYIANDGLVTLPLRHWNNLSAVDDEVPLLANKLGFRNLAGIAEGRSFINSTAGGKVSGTFDIEGSNPNYKYLIDEYDEMFKIAPYVLLPKHKLVLGFSSTPIQGTAPDDGSSAAWSELEGSKAVTTLAPGAGRLTLFGSLLRNNLPVESVSNQPLTSDAVHEALHFDNPVFDQFDVEPYLMLTGSYVDNVVSGSMFVAYDGNILRTKYSRRVVNTVSSGQAGTTGSLQRFVSLTDSAGTMYDSYPPNFIDIQFAAGRGFINDTSEYKIVVGTPVFAASYNSRGADTGWFGRFAYEDSADRFVEQNYDNSLAFAYTVNDVATATPVLLTLPRTAVIYGINAPLGALSAAVVTDINGNINTDDSFKEMLKALFGFGDGIFNVPYGHLTRTAVITAPPKIRGYKYGLAGLFGSKPDARFRRDRYGQFRDMLEQRRHPATLLRGGTVEYPLEIVFKSRAGGVTDPSKTHSQNLSPFSSSSKPYFDGLVVDRSDDPDRVLVPIDIDITLT